MGAATLALFRGPWRWGRQEQWIFILAEPTPPGKGTEEMSGPGAADPRLMLQEASGRLSFIRWLGQLQKWVDCL